MCVYIYICEEIILYFYISSSIIHTIVRLKSKMKISAYKYARNDSTNIQIFFPFY